MYFTDQTRFIYKQSRKKEAGGEEGGEAGAISNRVWPKASNGATETVTKIDQR